MKRKDIEILQSSLEILGTCIPSGSYFICGNEKNDIDFFIYGSAAAHKWLRENGFSCALHAVSDEQMEDSMKGVDGFVSYRKDRFNVIAIRSVEKLKKIKLATELCKALKLKDKSDVLMVFNAIQLGVVSSEKTASLEKKMEMF